MKDTDIKDLIGKTITEITGMSPGDDEIRFTCSDGSVYAMYHEQDCCENVRIEDVIGDPSDLLNSPIVMAEAVSSTPEWTGEEEPEYPDSWTWTFYKLATASGYVTLRWLGESNGYYSESVDFTQCTSPKQ